MEQKTNLRSELDFWTLGDAIFIVSQWFLDLNYSSGNTQRNITMSSVEIRQTLKMCEA